MAPPALASPRLHGSGPGHQHGDAGVREGGMAKGRGRTGSASVLRRSPKSRRPHPDRTTIRRSGASLQPSALVLPGGVAIPLWGAGQPLWPRCADDGGFHQHDSPDGIVLRHGQIPGTPLEHGSRFDAAQGVHKQIWRNGTTVMAELCWPVRTVRHDTIATEAGWTVQSRVGWNPQDYDKPFREESVDQTRGVTIYARTARRQLDDRAR